MEFESAEVDVNEIVDLARLAVFPRSSGVQCDFLDSNNNASAKRNKDSEKRRHHRCFIKVNSGETANI